MQLWLKELFMDNNEVNTLRLALNSKQINIGFRFSLQTIK